MDQKARLEELRETIRDLAESHPKARAAIIDCLALQPKAPLVAELPDGPGWASLCEYYREHMMHIFGSRSPDPEPAIDYLSITRDVSA